MPFEPMSWVKSYQKNERSCQNFKMCITFLDTLLAKVGGEVPSMALLLEKVGWTPFENRFM